MPEYLHPGVYIEEIERGPRPIEGVPTSTAALIGEAERGSTTPRLVTSYKDYQRWFGDVFDPNKFLPYAANGFFENGGKRAFICRLVGNAATTASAAFGNSFSVRAAGPGLWGTRVFAKISQGRTLDAAGNAVGFNLQLAYWNGPAPSFDPFAERTRLPRPQVTEEFEDLVTDESSPDFYAKRVPFIDLDKPETNQGPESSGLGVLVRNSGAPAGARPDDGATLLANGANDPVALGTDDYIGAAIPGGRGAQGLSALELDPYRDVALVYAPFVSNDIAKQIVLHCEKLKFRFAVIDSPNGQSSTTGLNPRNAVTGINDTSFAAFYYPWIVTSDPRTGARKLIPPGGHVLGVYARSDTERGVFKAPANEIVRGALNVEFDINDEMQDDLNPKGVNVIRSFPARGIRVWGARTLSSNGLWKYVSVDGFSSFSNDQSTKVLSGLCLNRTTIASGPVLPTRSGCSCGLNGG